MSTSRMNNDGRPWPACGMGLEKSEEIALRVGLLLDTSPALYNVSTPSGMMTMRDVPTNTPIPTVEINRSRDCERGKESGNEPARKELLKNEPWNDIQCKGVGEPFLYLRYGHDGAQSEQHKEAVQHPDQRLPTALLIFRYLACQAWLGYLIEFSIKSIVRSFHEAELKDDKSDGQGGTRGCRNVQIPRSGQDPLQPYDDPEKFIFIPITSAICFPSREAFNPFEL